MRLTKSRVTFVAVDILEDAREISLRTKGMMIAEKQNWGCSVTRIVKRKARLGEFLCGSPTLLEGVPAAKGGHCSWAERRSRRYDSAGH